MQDDYEKFKGDGNISKEKYFEEHRNNYPALNASGIAQENMQNDKPGMIQKPVTQQQEPPVKQPKVKMKKQQQTNDNAAPPQKTHEQWV